MGRWRSPCKGSLLDLGPRARPDPERRMPAQPPVSRSSRLCLQGHVDLATWRADTTRRPPDQRCCHRWRRGRPLEGTRPCRWVGSQLRGVGLSGWLPSLNQAMGVCGESWSAVLCGLTYTACAGEVHKMAQNNTLWTIHNTIPSQIGTEKLVYVFITFRLDC